MVVEHADARVKERCLACGLKRTCCLVRLPAVADTTGLDDRPIYPMGRYCLGNRLKP